MSDYLDKIITKKKDGTQIASVPLQDVDAQTRLGTVEGKISTALTPISGNPISISGLKSTQLAVDPVITFEPIQDLHGQSKPYPAGGGKNLLPLTIDGIKAANTSGGSWNNNTWTYNGLAFTILTDSANNVIGININGKPTGGYGLIALARNAVFQAGSYKITGYNSALPTNANSFLRIYSATLSVSATSHGGGLEGSITFSSDATDALIWINIAENQQVNNIVFYPMLRLATESDATFAPYENICPISGYDKIEVLSCGKNLFDNNLSNLYRGGFNADGDFVGNPIDTRLCSDYICIKSNVDYYLSNVASLTVGRVGFWYDEFKNAISQITFPSTSATSGLATSPNNAKYIRICVPETSLSSAQLEENNQPTTYVPYHKTTDLSESLGQTVYGGTLDVRMGKARIKYANLDLSTLSWSYNSGWNCWASSLSAALVNSNDTPINAKADRYDIVKASGYTTSHSANTLAMNINKYLFVDNGSTTTSPTGQLVYELATYGEIQLTPHEISLLEQYAYVSTNGTTIALKYHNGEMATLGDVEELYKTVERDIIRSQHAYSTTEQVVGTWIDGKPLYERIFVTPSLSGSYDMQTGIPFGMAMIVGGYYMLNDNNSMIGLNEYFASANYSYCHAELDGDIKCMLQGYTGVGYIIVRYTKATD